MNFQLKSLSLAQAATLKTDVLWVLGADSKAHASTASKAKPAKASGSAKATQVSLPATAADPLSQLIALAQSHGDLPQKTGQWLAVHRPAGLACPRVLLLSATDDKPGALRATLQAAYPTLRAQNEPAKQLTLVFTQTPQPEQLRSAMLALAELSYSYTTTKPSAKARTLDKVLLGLPQAPSAALQNCFKHTQAALGGIELAKEWANRPANHATPTHLAEAAKKLASPSAKISCEVLGPKEVAKLGMGAFMAVAQGAQEPLRFIVLHYQGAAKTVAPTVLVGKGITFDTGGISIKPAAEMDEMKFDMAGAASVLGVFHALRVLQPAINVVGLIAAAENMPSASAVKPGDVVTSMSGQTIEILNTDAEGRLVLCDALSYAERFKPQAVIDIATLTGACVISLGAVRSGLFAPQDELAQALLRAGQAAQDPCWRMPLDDEYAEGLKSNFADVANVGGRAGGAITAAKFLQRFAGKFNWAHLDIAGTAWKSGAAKGATGRPVGLLLSYLLGEQPPAAQAASASAKA